jgi:glucan phosphoethanolaminetransferase (alkaline phosphatase superfamily)
VTACRTNTVEAVPCLLTRLGSAKLSIPVKEVSLIPIFKHLGFETRWYDMQNPGVGNTVYRICHQADLCRISIKTGPQALDEQLLPFLKESIAERRQTQLLVVLHLLGSHAVYAKRYPPAMARYQPECKTAAYTCAHAEVVNSYDNSILYTDHVLNDVIELLRSEKAILFFTSDHGESLGELGIYGHAWPTMLAPKEQMQVPLAIWASPKFTANRQSDWARLRKSASRNILA